MPMITFLQLAQRILEEEQRPLSSGDIWKIAQTRGYDREVATKGKTPWSTLGAMLYVEVRDNPSTVFATVGSRPKRFSLRSIVNKVGEQQLVATQPPVIAKKSSYLEKDLHPLVVYYGFFYLKAHLKTIRHHKSEKKEFGEWVHPDIVGCYFPFGDWKDEVVEVSSLMGNTAVRLFSFELKRELSLSNLREAFFQAVSNSSWANEGYLAAVDIDTDADFRIELERLSTSFGIGVIQIDIEDPDATNVVLPAKSKDIVDWETINKLASINPDFRDFLKRIRIDIQSREIRQELYDRVYKREELLQMISKSTNTNS
jgi:hypothetical protein